MVKLTEAKEVIILSWLGFFVGFIFGLIKGWIMLAFWTIMCLFFYLFPLKKRVGDKRK